MEQSANNLVSLLDESDATMFLLTPTAFVRHVFVALSTLCHSHPSDAIYIRTVHQQDVLPKQRPAGQPQPSPK